MIFWRLANPEQFAEPALASYHNHLLCALGVLLAVTAAAVLIPVIERYRAISQFHSPSQTSRILWLTAGSITMGTGIWAMHFTAMLAYHLPVKVDYDVLITILSIIPAILASGATIVVIHPEKQSSLRLHASALMLAVGIGSMHYLGMEAVIVDAEMYYVPSLFALSIVAAYLFALVGLFIRFYIGKTRVSKHLAHLLGNISLGLAVSLMHFTAMAATYFQPTAETVIAEIQSNVPLWMIASIGSASVFLVIILGVGVLVDAYRWRMESLLSESELRFKRLSESSSSGIFTCDTRIRYCNPALAEVMGATTAALTSKSVADVFGPDVRMAIEELLETSDNQPDPLYEQIEVKDAQGNPRWLHFSLNRTSMNAKDIVIGSVIDISKQKKTESELRKLAYRDQLTQVGNRTMFTEQLQHHLNLRQRQKNSAQSVVILLDIEDFKSINDRFGHMAGDRMLIHFASELQKIMRKTEVLARWSGDEFAILADQLDDGIGFVQLLERIAACSKVPIRIAESEDDLFLKLCIGVVMIDESYLNVDEVMQHADIARFRNKAQMQDAWVIYDAEIDAATKRKRMLRTELGKAIKEGGLSLNYQPIFSAADSHLCGFEALVRWQLSEDEWVSPAEFIPIAEKSNLITPLTLFVLEQACRDLGYWQSQNPRRDYYMSINLDATTLLSDSFHELLSELMRKYDFLEGRLNFELTERVLMKNTEQLMTRMMHCIRAGCNFMLDDFGTGFSSLSYLPHFPISTIKIDQAFIRNLDETGVNHSIVKAIVALSKGIDAKLVAEGVETEHQRTILQAMGCQQLQGFLLARPMTAENALAQLTRVKASASA